MPGQNRALRRGRGMNERAGRLQKQRGPPGGAGKASLRRQGGLCGRPAPLASTPPAFGTATHQGPPGPSPPAGQGTTRSPPAGRAAKEAASAASAARSRPRAPRLRPGPTLIARRLLPVLSSLWVFTRCHLRSGAASSPCRVPFAPGRPYLPGTAAPAPPRPWRRAVDRATGRARIDASDRQSALCFSNPPPRGGAAIGGSSRDSGYGVKTTSPGMLRAEGPSPPGASGEQSTMGSVGGRWWQLALQTSHPRSPRPSTSSPLAARQCWGDPMRFGSMKICMPHLSYFWCIKIIQFALLQCKTQQPRSVFPSVFVEHSLNAGPWWHSKDRPPSSW